MDALKDDAGRVEMNPDLPPLSFDFVWDGVEAGGSAAECTTGTLNLTTYGQNVWMPNGQVRWAWIELLEWFNFSWATLLYEDGLPFKADPPTAPDLFAHVRRESKYSAEGTASELEIRLWEFLENHDVSRALEGTALPTLIIWREGRLGHVLTDDLHARCEWSELLTSLNAAGEAVVARLSQSPAHDRRAVIALERWATRDQVAAEEIVGIATDLEGARLAPVVDFLSRLKRDTWDSNPLVAPELLAAARMTSGLSTDAIVEILGHVSEVQKGSTELIDRAAAPLVGAVALDVGRPYQQGHALGEALRESMGLQAHKKFDARRWLDSHRVEYRIVALGSPAVDALACWGPSVGPAVLVNSRGWHAKAQAGRNASIAHEICHLLVDRAGALPAAEVLGGRVNPAVEARARAFAAEVLLPRRHAGLVMRAADDAEDAARLVKSLRRSHGVSAEVVAWQARNSDEVLRSRVLEYLRQLVGSPWTF